MTAIPPANPAHQLRERYRQDKKQLLDAVQNQGKATRGIRQTLRQLAQLTDALLQDLWHHSQFDDGCCLVAV
ncbi:MAG: hypothetical protein ACOVO0_09565, partial [Burkholderiaceae bacterium]